MSTVSIFFIQNILATNGHANDAQLFRRFKFFSSMTPDIFLGLKTVFYYFILKLNKVEQDGWICIQN